MKSLANLYQNFNSTTDPMAYSINTILSDLAEWFILGKTRISQVLLCWSIELVNPSGVIKVIAIPTIDLFFNFVEFHENERHWQFLHEVPIKQPKAWVSIIHIMVIVLYSSNQNLTFSIWPQLMLWLTHQHIFIVKTSSSSVCDVAKFCALSHISSEGHNALF